jgi:ribosomal protein L7/L12
MRHPRVFFPPEALEALRQGNALEAIKRLRDSAGLGEARQRVDARAPGFPATPPPPDLMRALPPDAAMALARGNKIEAIKIYRELTDVGLAEAKQVIDGIESRLGL